MDNKILTHRDDYDVEEWTDFLRAHDVDIDDTQAVEFKGSELVIHRYATDADGHRYNERLATGAIEVAMLPPFTITEKQLADGPPAPDWRGSPLAP